VSPIPTKFKFKDYEKAIYKIAENKQLILIKESKRGSGRRYEVFKIDGDGSRKLKSFWVVHENKQIYTRDMSKCLEPLGITKEYLLSVLEDI